LEILVGIVGLLLLLNLGQLIALCRMTGRVRYLVRLLQVTDHDSLDVFIKASQADIENLRRRLDDILAWQRRTDEILAECARTPVLVRYRAFEGVGGDQSYSCAFLDGRGDGVILTSLYSPSCSYSYGKPVQRGQSDYALSAEEQEVLDQVLSARRQSSP
jgi:hypothetical protein